MAAGDEQNCCKICLLFLFTLADNLKDTVVFKVPVSNDCVESIDIRSDTSFETFRHLIAQGMDISVKRLNIGYTLSTWTAKDPAAVLSKVSHLVGLFEAISKERVRLDKAKRKGNNVKDLYVKIKDLNSAKSTKNKSANKVNCQLVCIMYLCLLTLKFRERRRVRADDDDPDEKSDDEGAKDEAPKKISAEWALELDNELRCDRKGAQKCDYGKCWKADDPVSSTGEKVHHPINPRNGSFWLLALVSSTCSQEFRWLTVP